MKALFYFMLIFTISSASLISQNYKEVSKELGVNHVFNSGSLIGGGVAIFDYNNDGWMDIYMTGGLYPDKLFRNDGNGQFTDVSAGAGIKLLPKGTSAITEGVITGDINNDGFEDIYITMYGGFSEILYKNMGDGTFKDISNEAGITSSPWSMGACFVDINLDGYLDIYTTLYSSNFQNLNLEKHKIYINNKNETFSIQTDKYGLADSAIYGLSVQATDFDNDNDLDLLVANDFGFVAAPNQLYENLYPKDTLHEIARAVGFDAAIFGMGIGSVDIDEDGDMDYYVTNIGKNLFYRNNGNKTFTNIAKEAGIEHGFVGTLRTTAWSPIFLDIDNDTHLDFALTNGFVGEANTSLLDPNKLWRNKGNGTFEDVTDKNGFADPSRSRGMAVGDLNNDGKMDIIVVNIETDPETKNHNGIYMNRASNNNNWFKLKLEGTTSNRSAIGARAIAYAGGRLFLREVEGGGGPHLSSNTRVQHWGLGTLKIIDSLKIIWPGGATQKFTRLPVNVQLTVKQNTRAEIRTTNTVVLCKGDFYEGEIYNESTILENKKIAQNGLDSICKVSIVVNPTYKNLSFVGICAGEKFRDLALANDTIIVDNLKTVTGCDSVCSYNITVHQPINLTQTLTFCDFANIDNVNYTSSRTISKTFKTAIGCDSTMVTNLIINKSVVSEEKVTICAGDIFRGKVYNSNDNLLLNLKTIQGCDSTHTIQINVKPKATNYKDTLILAGQMYDGVKYDSSDRDYEFTQVIKNGASNGCDSNYIVKLRVRTPQSIASQNEFASLNIVNTGNQQYQILYSLAKETAVSISIINSNGSEVANYNLGNSGLGEHKYDISTANFAKGAYFVTMKINSGVLTQKLILID